MSVAAIVAASGLAAAALLAPGARARAWAMLGALGLTAGLLVGEAWATPQAEALRDATGLAAGAAAAGVAVAGGLAVLFSRRPALLAGFAVAALPFRVPVESGGATAGLLVPLYVVVAGGALAWLVPRLGPAGRGVAGRARPVGWLERLLAAAVVLFALQAAYGPGAAEAVDRAAFHLLPGLLLFTVLRELEWTPRLLGACLVVLAGVAAVLAAAGVAEFARGELWLTPQAAAADRADEFLRVGSVLFDPDLFGRLLAVVITGLGAVLLWRREPRPAALAAAGLVVAWAGLLVTLSRPAYAALLAGLVVLAALRWAPWRVLAAAVAVVAGAVVLAAAVPEVRELEATGGESIGAVASAAGERLEGGAELARSRPVAGHGSGAFADAYRRAEGGSSERAAAASRAGPLTVAAEQGALGLIVLLALLAAALARLLRGARRSAAHAALAAGFVAVVVHSWLHAAFLEDPLTWLLLAAGAALARERPRRVARERAAPASAETPVPA